ncbi:hypothetical protein [Stutzerimonas stutzeri]|uniref:hypothetical protein n=1 Tax=Stutzerimonas stutzeri TaxID=316 RepID=UPI00265D1C8B|nr:hypothetical protein [Stutzerimonas stutzeri]MCF6783707.1 hypothetical protein [Stutzerimonas stutzeri]
MTASIARIYVNDIEVGSLPTETYNEIAKKVRKNRRLYLAWVLAFAEALLRILVRFYGSLPSVFVGLFLLCAAVSPETFTSVVAELKAASPEAITEGVRKLLGFISIVVSVTLPFVLALFPGYARFQSPFEQAVSREIRGLLEVPTEGALRVDIEHPRVIGHG